MPKKEYLNLFPYNSSLQQKIKEGILSSYTIDKRDYVPLNLVSQNRQDIIYKINTILIEILNRAIALFLLLIFSPLFFLISFSIKALMPGKIFYKQMRVGKYGKKFVLYKFRSMIENAEKKTGHILSFKGDTRITKLGYYLRKTHLDELPQLFNVLKGDMLFLGPRPERPEFTRIFESKIRNYKTRHIVKPGITGLAQILCPYNEKAEEKLKFDLFYIKNSESISLQFFIVICTIRKMLFMNEVI